MDRKGQFESILVIVVFIFVIGFFLLFFRNMNDQIYDSFGDYFEQDPTLNNTEAHQTLTSIQESERSLWDYVFLACFIGFILQACLFSYMTRVSIAFFWIFVILGIVGLIVMIVLSVTWQELAAQPDFASTLSYMPITNFILGSYAPTIFVGILVLMLAFLFGKPPESA